jgi:hypothetical protein
MLGAEASVNCAANDDLNPNSRLRVRWRRLERHELTVGNIVTLAAISLLIAVGCSRSSKSEVSKLLAEAKLSPLPPSATNVAYYRWNGLFTGETYAKFELSPGDLRAFVSDSLSLRDVKPKKIYDTNYQHVPFPQAGAERDFKHYDYFHRHRKFPSSYDWTIRGKGKKYVIDWGPNMMILIDEDRHIVWLHLVKG